MTAAKKIIAVILSLILVACPLLMTANALDIGGIFAEDETSAEAEETTNPLVALIKELFAKIKAKIMELLAKVGFEGPAEELVYEPRTWETEPRSVPVYAPLLNEYLTVINSAKHSASPLAVYQDVHSSYTYVKTICGDMTIGVVESFLDQLYPEYKHSVANSTDAETAITDYMEPFGADAAIALENVKTGTRTVNSDNTVTITLTLYAELYTDSCTIHSGVISHCYSMSDFKSAMFTTEKFQAYANSVTLSITFDQTGKLISQSNSIPVSYDFSGTYVVGKNTKGGGFISIDTLIIADYSYTWL